MQISKSLKVKVSFVLTDVFAAIALSSIGGRADVNSLCEAILFTQLYHLNTFIAHEWLYKLVLRQRYHRGPEWVSIVLLHLPCQLA